jgi:hypothetical protein
MQEMRVSNVAVPTLVARCQVEPPSWVYSSCPPIESA